MPFKNSSSFATERYELTLSPLGDGYCGPFPVTVYDPAGIITKVISKEELRRRGDLRLKAQMRSLSNKDHIFRQGAFLSRMK